MNCLNLHRRHLSEGQRATVAAKLANITNGGDRRSDQSANLHSGSVSQADAAQMLNVSTRSVTAAAKVLHDGDADLVHAVKRCIETRAYGRIHLDVSALRSGRRNRVLVARRHSAPRKSTVHHQGV